MAITILDTLTNIENQIAQLNSENTSSTATLTQVAASATSVVLLAANSSRKGLTLFNDSQRTAYVTFGATSSASSFTFKLPGGALYEGELPNYVGVVSCIWDSASGQMHVTELT